MRSAGHGQALRLQWPRSLVDPRIPDPSPRGAGQGRISGLTGSRCSASQAGQAADLRPAVGLRSPPVAALTDVADVGIRLVSIRTIAALIESWPGAATRAALHSFLGRGPRRSHQRDGLPRAEHTCWTRSPRPQRRRLGQAPWAGGRADPGALNRRLHGGTGSPAKGAESVQDRAQKHGSG